MNRFANYYRVLALVALCVLMALGAAGCSATTQSVGVSEQSAEVNSSPDDGANGAEGAGYKKITPEEAHNMMAELTGFILLDVRTEEEYREKRIEGAVLIPDTEIKDRAEAELTDKGQTILVYCRGGGRSANAAKTLAGLGYTNVYDMGGLNDWPYDTISG